MDDSFMKQKSPKQRSSVEFRQTAIASRKPFSGTNQMQVWALTLYCILDFTFFSLIYTVRTVCSYQHTTQPTKPQLNIQLTLGRHTHVHTDHLTKQEVKAFSRKYSYCIIKSKNLLKWCKKQRILFLFFHGWLLVTSQCMAALQRQYICTV